MNKQEEIRVGLAKECYRYYPWENMIPWDETDEQDREECYIQSEALLAYLQSKGVVIGDMEDIAFGDKPIDYEPLIKE